MLLEFLCVLVTALLQCWAKEYTFAAQATQEYPHESKIWVVLLPPRLYWTSLEQLNFSVSINQHLSCCNKPKSCSYENLIKIPQNENWNALLPDVQRLYKYLSLNHIIIISQTAPYFTASWMLPGKSGAAQALKITHCTRHDFKIYTTTRTTSRALPLYHTVKPAKIRDVMQEKCIRKNNCLK